jgi:iron(III) transport system permease protein
VSLRAEPLRRAGRALATPRRSPAPLAVLVPALGIAAIGLLPVVYLLVRASTADARAIALIVRPATLDLLARSLALALAVAIVAVAIGLPLAWLTTRTDLPGRRLWAIVTAVPLAVPSYVLAYAFVAAFGPRGAVSDLLEPAGMGRLPSFYGFPAALVVLSLATYPYVLLSVRAALLRSDPAIEEAARSLGDGPLTAFRRATLPMLLPAVTAGALLAALYAVSDFGAVSIVDYQSFARAVYLQYRASFDRSAAALLALMLVVVAWLLVTAEWRIRRRVATIDHGRRREPRPVALGRWRIPALLFCAAVTAIGLVLPIATIAFWLARAVSEGQPVVELARPAIDSVVAGTGAAMVALVLALPVAVVLARSSGRAARAVERILYGAYALPGIVVALALVFFTLNILPALYQTLVMLVLAYAVRFLPQAVAPVRTSLRQIGPRITEAARNLGERPWGVFRTITVPLLRPGLVAGGALVFLSTVKELPLTLLVAPTGFRTLATTVWDAASEGFFARAAAPAGALILLSAVTVALLLRAEDPLP